MCNLKNLKLIIVGILILSYSINSYALGFYLKTRGGSEFLSSFPAYSSKVFPNGPVVPQFDELPIRKYITPMFVKLLYTDAHQVCNTLFLGATLNDDPSKLNLYYLTPSSCTSSHDVSYAIYFSHLWLLNWYKLFFVNTRGFSTMQYISNSTYYENLFSSYEGDLFMNYSLAGITVTNINDKLKILEIIAGRNLPPTEWWGINTIQPGLLTVQLKVYNPANISNIGVLGFGAVPIAKEDNIVSSSVVNKNIAMSMVGLESAPLAQGVVVQKYNPLACFGDNGSIVIDTTDDSLVGMLAFESIAEYINGGPCRDFRNSRDSVLFDENTVQKILSVTHLH